MAALEQHTSKPQPENDIEGMELKTLVTLWKQSGRNVPAFIDLVEKSEGKAQNGTYDSSLQGF